MFDKWLILMLFVGILIFLEKVICMLSIETHIVHVYIGTSHNSKLLTIFMIYWSIKKMFIKKNLRIIRFRISNRIVWIFPANFRIQLLPIHNVNWPLLWIWSTKHKRTTQRWQKLCVPCMSSVQIINCVWLWYIQCRLAAMLSKQNYWHILWFLVHIYNWYNPVFVL